jgi:hypothetical protein
MAGLFEQPAPESATTSVKWRTKADWWFGYSTVQRIPLAGKSGDFYLAGLFQLTRESVRHDHGLPACLLLTHFRRSVKVSNPPLTVRLTASNVWFSAKTADHNSVV